MLLYSRSFTTYTKEDNMRNFFIFGVIVAILIAAQQVSWMLVDTDSYNLPWAGNYNAIVLGLFIGLAAIGLARLAMSWVSYKFEKSFSTKTNITSASDTLVTAGNLAGVGPMMTYGYYVLYRDEDGNTYSVHRHTNGHPTTICETKKGEQPYIVKRWWQATHPLLLHSVQDVHYELYVPAGSIASVSSLDAK